MSRVTKGLVVRNPVFGVSDQVQHKPGCAFTEDDERLEISDLARRGIVLICVAKVKELISCAVTVQLICVSVLAYIKSRFSHDAAEILHG